MAGTEPRVGVSCALSVTSMRDGIQYAEGFHSQQRVGLADPKALDTIRANIGRLSRVKHWQEKEIGGERVHSNAWHAAVTESMFRQHCVDRGLGQLLGSAVIGHEDGLDYVQFEYKQPCRLEDRGVDWLSQDASTFVACGHGTYWETFPWIMATGVPPCSGADSTFGQRQWEGTQGTYVAPSFADWAGHYSWPSNVFGNKCFYGVGFRVLACDKYLKKANSRPWSGTTKERVYDERGVVITHVVVTFNRSIKQGHSRERYYLPECEFCHGGWPFLRKYPDLRASVWSNEGRAYSEETYGMPPWLPLTDTDAYHIPLEPVAVDEESSGAMGQVGGADGGGSISESLRVSPPYE